MVDVSAGEFDIHVAAGYPYWVSLRYDSEELPFTLGHKELADLEYVVSRARVLLRAEIKQSHNPEHADEV